MCDDTWTADRRGMVRRCKFVPMDTRENGKCWTESILDTKEPRTCGVASSVNASFVSPPETVRHFPSTCQLLPVENNRVIRLPRDSVCFEDHSYTRPAPRVDLCIKCGLRLSGSGEQESTTSVPPSLPPGPPSLAPDPPSLPPASTVQSRLLGMRDELFFRAGGGSTAHLRELVSLQADLILSQQEQLLQRNAQLSGLGQEKALLESRIERLQRRVSLMQRTQATPTSSPDAAQRSRVRKTLPTPSNSTPIGDSPLSCTPKKRAPSPTASPTVQTPPPLASTPKRPRHRRERGKSRRSGSSASHVTHHVTYVGEPCNTALDEDQLYVFLPPPTLALPPYPGEGFVGENGEGEVSIADAEQQNGDVSNVNEDGTIMTPGWRMKPVQSLSRAALVAYQAAEEVQDDAFLRRHRKHEEGERRRKRWDNQRQREELERENLLKRYRQVHEKSNLKKGGDKKMASFNPPVLQVERIELSDQLPVSAFGCPVPKIKQSVFSLPWCLPESDGQS